MPSSFNDNLVSDHLNMISSDEFGVSCKNTRTGKTFDIIKTDAFISVTEEGLPIIEDKPMFNTIMSNDIKQEDSLTIDGKTFVVREVRKDGIGGIDIYLKD